MSEPDEVAAPKREVPAIPRREPQDVPPGGGGAEARFSTARQRAVADPEGDHRRELEKSKLRFAIRLTAGCTVAAVAVGMVEYFWPSGDPSATLTSVGDLLKLLATTALGFVFGRSLSKSE